jgi:hypothetical protein
MRRFKLPLSLVGLAITPILVVSCGKSKDSDGLKNSALGLAGLNFESIKLSKTLNFRFPSGVENLGRTATALALAPESAGKKSLEACRTAQQVDEVFSLFSVISKTFCHLEAESARIQFGKKYNVILSEGPSGDEKFSVWVDNSGEGKLIVYQCFNNKLQQKITIHAATEAGAKGNMTLKFTDANDADSSDIGVNLDFDMSLAGEYSMKAQVAVDSGPTSTYREAIEISLGGGLSRFSSAAKGVNGGKDFAIRGLMKHTGDHGQAILRARMFDDEWGDINYSSRSSFDADGVLIDNQLAPSAVRVDPAELPSYLSSAMTVEAPSGWDCQGEETLTVNLLSSGTSAAHQACFVDSQDVQFEDCFGSEFASGDDEEIEE